MAQKHKHLCDGMRCLLIQQQEGKSWVWQVLGVKKIEKKATFKDYPDKHVSLWGEKNHLRVNLFEKKNFFNLNIWLLSLFKFSPKVDKTFWLVWLFAFDPIFVFDISFRFGCWSLKTFRWSKLSHRFGLRMEKRGKWCWRQWFEWLQYNRSLVIGQNSFHTFIERERKKERKEGREREWDRKRERLSVKETGKGKKKWQIFDRIRKNW